MKPPPPPLPPARTQPAALGCTESRAAGMWQGCGLLGLGKLLGGGAVKCSPQGLWAPDVSFWHSLGLG